MYQKPWLRNSSNGSEKNVPIIRKDDGIRLFILWIGEMG